ncbi:cation:proton antiporter [Rhodopirellula sp. MGV]|uniref:cation:proton antiporter n=1 Tax=Rhodopirellula sp. MGV TaxID=2023130 RepID=UPI000B97B561|nr:cation:proton antiporter [Rhodopirellula sp. MGV]OYP34356.1 sodium:proton exchanger [Rhodopirellula sp. MGV]PNY35242.1 sodium:proton exchanger [Rhodopirellula baltica]
MELWELLADIVFLLLACLIGGGLASLVGQSPLVGYLLAGMLVGGPGSFDIVSAQHEIESVAELGVSLLLFSLGLEFSLQRLKELGSKPLLGGVLQVVLTLLAGSIVAWCFGMSISAGVAVGAMITLSSTAVVLRILMERGEIEMPHGRNSLGVLLTQDIAVVPLAVLMTVLGEGGTVGEVTYEVCKLALMAAGLAAVLYLLTKVAVLALGTLTLQRNRELTIIFAASMGLGAAWAAHSAGISPALGAFIAGMLLGSSAFATQIRADVSTLRVLLLTLFFGAAGMVADPLWIISHFHWVATVAIAVTLGKLLIVALIFVGLQQSLRVAAATGLSLAQVGEFAFVLGSVGRTSGVVTDGTYALIVSVTILSFFISALAVPNAPRFGDRVARLLGKHHRDSDNLSGASHRADVLVIGFGPTAQLATVPLMGSDFKVTVIDLNRNGVKTAIDYGFDGQYGDALLPDVLEHASVGEVKLAIVTLPHFRSALSAVELIRSMNPTATILVRSRYHIHRLALSIAGGTVEGDEDCVGDAMGKRVSEWYLEATKRSEI